MGEVRFVMLDVETGRPRMTVSGSPADVADFLSIWQENGSEGVPLATRLGVELVPAAEDAQASDSSGETPPVETGTDDMVRAATRSRRGEDRGAWSFAGDVLKELVYMPSIEPDSFMHLSTRGDTYALRTFRGGKPQLRRHVDGCRTTQDLLREHPAKFRVDVYNSGKRIEHEDEYWSVQTTEINKRYGIG